MISVAGISVVSSAAVAIGGLVVGYLGGREQRSHEKQLAFEGRAWDAKTEAHFEVIKACRTVIDTITSTKDTERERLAMALTACAVKLNEALPVIETYASPKCRTAFADLRALLLSRGRSVTAESAAERLGREKEEALDAENFDQAAHLRLEERAALAKASGALGLDRGVIQAKAESLVDAARESVRGGGA